VIHLILEGGEPTLRPDIDELISYAKNLGMLVMVITNGLHDLSDHDPDSYWISIEGYGKIHDQNRSKGTFERVVNNIKKNTEVNKVVGITLNERNKHQLEKIASFFSKITEGVWFNFMYPYKGYEDLALPIKEQREIAEKIMRMKRKGDYNIISSNSYLNSIRHTRKKEYCASFLTLLIDVDLTYHQGCTIEQIEECRCEVCNLGCYGELTEAINLKKDAIQFLKDTTGLNDGLLKMS